MEMVFVFSDVRMLLGRRKVKSCRIVLCRVKRARSPGLYGHVVECRTKESRTLFAQQAQNVVEACRL